MPFAGIYISTHNLRATVIHKFWHVNFYDGGTNRVKSCWRTSQMKQYTSIVLYFVIINLCKNFNNGEANRAMPFRHTVHRKQLYTCTPAATAVLYWSGCAQWVPSGEDETGVTHSHVSIARAKWKAVWPGLGPPEVSSDQCLSPGPHGGNTSYSTICPRQCTSHWEVN